MPEESLPRLSSFSEHIIPKEYSPLILPFLILNFSFLSYKVVPIVATGTFCPTSTLGAPHTICKQSSKPISTLVKLNLSAFGCLFFSIISPIKTPFKPPFILV